MTFLARTRQVVSVVTALTTLYGMSAGPCRHGDAQVTAADRVALEDPGSRASGGKCHRHDASADAATPSASHDVPAEGDASLCHCLGACCCTSAPGLATRVASEGAQLAAHRVTSYVLSTGVQRTRFAHLLPPSTAPPRFLVAT